MAKNGKEFEQFLRGKTNKEVLSEVTASPDQTTTGNKYTNLTWSLRDWKKNLKTPPLLAKNPQPEVPPLLALGQTEQIPSLLALDPTVKTPKTSAPSSRKTTAASVAPAQAAALTPTPSPSAAPKTTTASPAPAAEKSKTESSKIGTRTDTTSPRGVTTNVSQQSSSNRYGGQTQFFRAEKSPEEEAAYQAAQAAFDLQRARQDATTEVQTRTYTRPGETEKRTYGVRVPKKGAEAPGTPSEADVKQAFERSRQASAAVDETARQNKRISPAYWVTQADFNQAFGRNYNPMSREDQRDFFQLVQNAPGATRRTDVAGADVGAVIPSRQRPSSLPTFQDVDGIKVPEAAFGYSEKQQKQAQDLGFKTVQDYEQAKEMTGAYSEKPDFVVQREAEKLAKLQPISDKLIKDLSLLGYGKKRRGPSPYSERQENPLEDPRKALKFIQQYAPETLTPEQKRALGVYNPDLPYSRRGAGANYLPPDTAAPEPAPEPAPAPDPEPAPAPDPAPPPELPPLPSAPESGRAGTFPAPPISVASTIGLYGGQPTTTLQTPELLRRPTKETSEKPRKTNQIPDLLRAPPKEPKKGEYPSWFMRMQNQPLPASPPVEGLPFDRNKPLETSSSFSGMQTGAMGPSRSEAELSRMMRDAREAPSAVGSSTFPGIPSSVASLIAAYSPAPAPDSEPAPLPTPKLSAGEDGLPQFPDQFSRWYPPTVGPRQTPPQREPQIGRLEPIIEFEPAPAPEPKSLSDLELERMKRDAKESEPSGLQQAMRLAQGVGEFGRNLDQAAGRKVREAGQKISDIAKRFRTQRDENARKNIERLAAKGIKVPGFDTGDKGFGQRNVQYAEAGLDTEGPPSPASYGQGFEPAPAPEPPPAPEQNTAQVQLFTDEEKRQNIIQAYRELLGLDPVSRYRREAEQRQMEKEVEEMRKRGEILPGAMPEPKRGRDLEDNFMPQEMIDAIRQRDESSRKKSGRSAPIEGGMNVPLDIADFETPAVPQTVAAQISKEEKPKDETSSPISPEMASQMLQVQTPGQAPIEKPAKQTSVTPQSVAEYMKTVPVAKQITATPDAMRQRITPKQGVMSFTAGMSKAEVDQEFERIFGKPTSQRLADLSLNAKRDMIGRYRLKQAGEE